MPVPQDQGDQLELPRAQTQDGAQGADSPGAADRPARGSTADLRQRLEHLPQGHPSSPYHDDGTSKPPLARLKNLELPLPGEEREPNGGVRRDASGAQVTPRTGDRAAVADAAAGIASYPDPDVQDRQPVVREPDPAPSREPERREPADPGTAVSEPTGWDHLSARETDRPAARDRPPAQETTWGHAPEAQDQPDARDWSAAQEASWGQSPEPRDQPDARETVWGQPEPKDQPDAQEHDPEAHDEELAAEHQDDLDDDEPATQDQPAILDDQVPAPVEQSDSRRGENLTPEQVRLAVRTLGQCRLAEGRSVFGSYGDTGLTPAMRRIEDQLEHGELVPETEKYALKSLDRFQEKLAGMIADEPDKSAEEHAVEIHDAIRYTFLFDRYTYTQDLGIASDRLEEAGFTLVVRRNHWGDDEYKGVNTRWVDPESGLLFEVQFHTQKSWDTKQQSHDAYEKINDIRILKGEKERLRSYQRELSSEVPLPTEWEEITDYRREGW